MVLVAQELIPPVTADPVGVWFFNWVIPIAGSVFIVLAIADVVRRRRLTWGFLFLFNSMAVYWMETAGDWGQMLFYSPAFAEHHLLDWLPLKTPNDPLFMPFAYAAYWGVHALLVLWLSQWVSSRFGWSMLKSMIVLAIPVNYVWDFVVEGTATAMGWWTYDPGIGPVLEWDSGGRITLLWTIGIMCTWPNLIAYWAGKPPVRGLNHLERFFGLERFTSPKVLVREPVSAVGSGSVALSTEPARLTKTQEYDHFLNYDVTIARWKFELMRLGAWCVGFQLSFALFLVGPLLILRSVLGADSVYVP
ncbi:spirocyclase AveC family protein [Mycobacterium deserti]|uniref:Spirocyclase AveC family protein n=1 Tax=Mycobacterium deserti TaxID=2978347 RepID=A0ABT2M4M1_9MYCO|nr:spirocyclase AveC family protein [Mycobacterium deserti]MCT7657208.1 spirocyclase AveC family protein [Mycobacterium deserti]